MKAYRKLAAALAAGLGLCAWANGAGTRPLTVDDVLKMEALGETMISPDGRWLVFERRGPYGQGERFDYDRYSDLFRTTLQVVDLAAPGPGRPLLAHEKGVGYAAGPISPDGARQVIFRLKADRWELGVVTLASSKVTWTGLTPDYPEWGRALQWRTPTELVAITVPDGRLPFILRQAFLTRRMVSRWSAQARGDLAATVLGSGDYAELRPRDPPREVIALDVATGARRTLARGEFTDLELSGGGHWAAVLSAGPDIRMWPAQDFRTDTNIIRTRLRLALIDLDSGEVLRPCPRCDVLSQLLAWSPRGEALLIYARKDGQSWSQGNLLEVSAWSGQVRALTDAALRPRVFRRPETVIAGWLGKDPIVFAQASGQPRADLWRLSARAVALTGALPDFELAGATLSEDRLLVLSQGRVVALDRMGRVRATSPHPVAPPPAPSTYPVRRMAVSLSNGESLSGLGQTGDETRWSRMTADGRASRLAAPSGSELVQAGPNGRGLLVRVRQGGGEDQMLWVGPDGATTPLAGFNAHLRDVDRPRVLAVHHKGVDSEALVSWLVLPARATASPPPLVVFPYLGRNHRSPPAYLDPRLSPGVDWPRLLAGHGYAVLLPSLPIAPNTRAPSDGVAAAVLGIVEAAATQA
ncbi:MAG TPA: hypothetical protein VEA79_14400, partial [Phenylobacterium sp.]|nr:hypothetical protein [Phenylobacterium sp.]